MTIRHEKRHCISITMKEELYELIKHRCEEIDLPITVWVRELIKREIRNPTIVGLSPAKI